MRSSRSLFARVPVLLFVFTAFMLAAPARGGVDLAAPVEGPAVSGVIPPLPGTVPLFEPPAAWNHPLLVHEGRTTLVADPGGVPPAGPACAPLPPNPSGTTAAAALPGYVQDALSEANATVSQLDGGTISDFFDTFKEAVEILGGDVQVNISPTSQRCFAPAPAQVRWLRHQYVPRNFYWLPNQGEFSYSYGGRPVSFQEMRQRAARLYCASRTAQQHQSDTSSMGERIGFSVKILGQQIDFLVTEPTLALDGPERFTGAGANDGAQAFEIPLLLGTRITPIRGLGLPGFRELRVPVSLVVADTELRTASELRPVRTGGSVQCSFGGGPFPFTCSVVPSFETRHAKTHQTVTNLTRVRSASKNASIAGVTEIFRVGPLAVDLGFEIAYLLGGFTPGNDRILDFPGLPPARSGRLWIHPFDGSRRHDGPWSLRFFGPALSDRIPGLPYWTVLPDGLTQPFWREPLNFVLLPPFDVRLFQDDDHAVDTATGLDISGSLGGELGGSFGPFTVSLTVTGKITGSVEQHHRLREALLAEDLGGNAMTPATALRVRPQQTAQATLDPATGKLRLTLSLPWPFDDIDMTKTLFSVPAVTLAQYDSDTTATAADEILAFQLGTGSAKGNVSEQPVARSHLPGGLEFASFPVDVDACLADESPNPPTPPPCKPTQSPGKPPSAEICLYGPSADTRELLGALPPNVCADVPGHVSGLGFDAAKTECLERFLGFLCSPVSKQQTHQSLSVVAHVLDLLDDEEGHLLSEVLMTCAEAFDTPGPDGLIDTTYWSEQFVATALCTADGTLLGPSDLFDAVGDPTKAPPVVPASSCQ